MTHIYVFNGVLVAVSLYALMVGGTPERAVALIFLSAAAASFLALRTHPLGFDVNLVWIDVVAFCALTCVALRANRFWPLYQSALQLLTIGVHGVKVYNPQLADWMWAGASAKLAYPTLILLALGVLRHRQRIAASGIDRDWSPSGRAVTT